MKMPGNMQNMMKQAQQMQEGPGGAHGRKASIRISLVGRPILAAAAFQAASRLKAGCGQNCPPHKLRLGWFSGLFVGRRPIPTGADARPT